MPLLGKYVCYVWSPQTQNVMRIFRSARVRCGAEGWQGLLERGGSIAEDTQKLLQSLWQSLSRQVCSRQKAGRQEQASCERAASARRETIARKRQREREWERDTIIGLKAQANCRCHSALHPFELCVKLSAVSAKGCNNFGAANAKETPRDLRNIKLFARESETAHTHS